MKNILPKLFLPVVLFLSALLFITFTAQPAHAADATTDTGEVLLPTGGTWVIDPEVTFTGKNAARSRDLLNWTLQDYRWTFTKAGAKNPLEGFWIIIRNIIYSVFILFVIATAFILIATRGKSLSAMRFLPRFFAIVLLVTFSFSMISLLYQTTDLVQGFFLKSPRPEANNQPCPPACISQEDLFFIDWAYKDFIGYRLVGEEYSESAFINLLLVKLTAFTYFVMVGMLFVRKIILWFFIILSPVFPLLLLYYPVRNTAKIWIGEFFRWLLYAPLFAIFLAGLVRLWQAGIPLNFDFSLAANSDRIVYPTATSILIGGPSQQLALNNSANIVNTFAQYVVALLMLWMVILLPWVLLQIFLDYAMNYNYAENPAFKGLMGWANRVKGPQPPPPPSPKKPGPDIPPMKKPIIPPIPPAGAGLARTIPTESTAVYKQPSLVIKPMPSFVQTLRMTNLSVPTLRDVARFETAMVSNRASEVHEISRVKDTLTKLSNPANITNATEKTKFNEVRERLLKESQSGNIMASTIMNASNVMNIVNNTTSQVTNQVRESIQNISHPETVVNMQARQKFVSLKEALTSASEKGDQFAKDTLNSMSNVLSAATPQAQQVEVKKLQQKLTEEKQKGNELAKQLSTYVGQQTTQAVLPQQNKVQTVSLEDYEAVRKMWEKNYQTMDVPQSIDKGQVSRKQWIQDDINDISKTINMLSSSDPEVVDQGIQEVSNILPFLLMGGFSLSEIVAYLKAKQQAATDSLEQVKAKEAEDESLVEKTEHATAAAVKHQTMTIPTPEAGTETAASAGVSSSGTSFSSESADEDGGSMLSNITKSTTSNPTATTVQSAQPASQQKSTLFLTLKLPDVHLPKLSDIVHYDAAHLVRNEAKQQEMERIKTAFTKLANPQIIASPEEQAEVTKAKDTLVKDSETGDVTAKALLAAADVFINPTAAVLPQQNQVQTVSLEDYEAVRKMWENNYRTMEVPSGAHGQLTREEWMKNEMQHITETINMLSSGDRQVVDQGLQHVSTILPFLMMGGFSLSEVISYLKAKEEAAKTIVDTKGKQAEGEEVEVMAKKSPPSDSESASIAVDPDEEEKKQGSN